MNAENPIQLVSPKSSEQLMAELKARIPTLRGSTPEEQSDFLRLLDECANVRAVEATMSAVRGRQRFANLQIDP